MSPSSAATISTGIISGSLMYQICCHPEAPSMRDASSAERGSDCSAASERMKMKGVHCQTSAMITDGSDHAGSDSQGIDSKPQSLSVRLKMPTLGWYMERHIRPTTIGAIIIGRMKIVRSTDIPRICRSSSSASPTPTIISRLTTAAANLSVTAKDSWKFGSSSRLR